MNRQELLTEYEECSELVQRLHVEYWTALRVERNVKWAAFEQDADKFKSQTALDQHLGYLARSETDIVFRVQGELAQAQERRDLLLTLIAHAD